jgi:vitamin K-dependent gamma-carboxylase
VYAQPLNLWLSARVDLPVLGPWLSPWWVALAMSWAGFLFDTTIPLWLSWRRSRPWAFAVVVCFHVGTHLLFTIGLFPIIMVSSALIFFGPSWPRRWLPAGLRAAPALSASAPFAPARGAWAVLGALAVFEVLMPLRAHLYAEKGAVIWHEQGMRWSWRVMVREKNGSVTYRVRLPGDARERIITPSRYLTAHQEREMSGQPDLILQLGHHIARDLERQRRGPAQVRVDALVSLNGRRPARLIDPDVDLATIPDGVALAPWILPAPEEPPPRLRASR